MNEPTSERSIFISFSLNVVLFVCRALVVVDQKLEEMEGSRRSSGGSGSRLGMSSGAGFNKRDGWGLPPTAPRPNRRSARRGNFNNGNSEMIVDVQMEQSADERAYVCRSFFCYYYNYNYNDVLLIFIRGGDLFMWSLQ